MHNQWSMLTKFGIVMGVVAVLVVVSMLAPAAPTPTIAAGFTPTEPPPSPPPTQPPPPPSPQPTEQPAPSPDDCLVAIRGRVTDLCTGEPARGVQVSINGVVVTTDSQGDYSLTGQLPGTYVVTVLVDSAWQPSTQTLYLTDCGQVGIADLTFDSCLPAGAAPTEAPALLPETGGVIATPVVPGTSALVGFGLVVVGLAGGLIFALRPRR